MMKRSGFHQQATAAAMIEQIIHPLGRVTSPPLLGLELSHIRRLFAHSRFLSREGPSWQFWQFWRFAKRSLLPLGTLPRLLLLRGAKRRSNPVLADLPDCFAELVIGPATSGRTRWLAMTKACGKRGLLR
jgi:hypothetical protein